MPIKLEISNLHVAINGTEIIHGVDFAMNTGEVVAIMGPNGSGKSTLSQVIFGHPQYKVTSGSIRFKDQEVLALSPDKRAQLGLFLAFQYPHAVPGVKISSFLKQATNAKQRAIDPSFKGLKMRDYRELLENAMDRLHMKKEFGDRYVNDGFSGGEKKKSEILQMSLLKPDIAVLDEIDSGLDVDALRVVCDGVRELQAETGMGALIITHYPRILKYLPVDTVYVMIDGKIVKSGGAQLADQIEEKGYDWLRQSQ